MTSDFFAIDGRVMPAADAVLPVLDLGFLRGLGAFETFRTYGGHPHALPAHLDRLWGTAALFGVAPCFTDADLRRVVARIRAGDFTPGPSRVRDDPLRFIRQEAVFGGGDDDASEGGEGS